MWKRVSKVRDKSKCKFEVGVEGCGGMREAQGVGKGLNVLL